MSSNNVDCFHKDSIRLRKKEDADIRGKGGGTRLVIVRTAIFFIFSSVVVAGCKYFTPSMNKRNANGKAGIIRAKRLDNGTFFWTHFDASKRASLVYVTSGGNVRVLAENSPDAAFKSSMDALGKVIATSGSSTVSAETKFSLAKDVVELGKRNATVNVLRDALYRLNEVYYNALCLDCTSDAPNQIVQTNSLQSGRTTGTPAGTVYCAPDCPPARQFASDQYRQMFDSVLATARRIADSEFKSLAEEAKIEEAKSKVRIEEVKLDALKIQVELEKYRTANNAAEKNEDGKKR
jgi:hypothetical protein